MLYRKTLFDFTMCPQAILLLPKRIPQAHIACITHINLTWEWFCLPINPSSRKHSKAEREWSDTWENLAAMEGLEYLRVALIIPPMDAIYWIDQEQQLLKCVKRVTAPLRFELTLPFPASPKSEQLPNAIIHRV
jgi:hypothetical protein